MDQADQPPDRIGHPPAGIDTDAWLGHYQRSLQTYPQIEEALRYFRQIFDLAPSPYVVTDASLVIADANVAAQRFFNRPITGLRGKPLSVFVTPSEQTAFRTIASEIADAEGWYARPLSMRPWKGPDVETHFKAVQIGADTQQQVTILWLFQDASDSVVDDLL